MLRFTLKSIRILVVAGGWGALAWWAWSRLRPAPAPVTASPYPAPGAHAAPMPADPVGPMEPALAGSSA